MKTVLGEILDQIGESYKQQIQTESKNYLEVDLGRQAVRYGHSELLDRYGRVMVIIPLKEAAPGMKVLIDGRTFRRYARLPSGIAVAEYVARESGLPYQKYHAPESMILNFA